MLDPRSVLVVTEQRSPRCVVSDLWSRGERAVDLSSVTSTEGRVLTRTATVFSGFTGAFMGLVVSVVFLWNTVGLCETRVASWVVGVASSGCSVDFAETCVVF